MFVLFGSIRRPMAASLESFCKLLDWIDRMVSVRGNESLRAELQRRYGGVAAEARGVEEIERYLGLDYAVDSLPCRIDYTFVQSDNPVLYDQLVSDFREMMRNRYGTRYHKIDFDEYCKYAHFQAEALTNYFLKTVSGNDFEKTKILIVEYQQSRDKEYRMSSNIHTIEAIPYSQKMWTVCHQINNMKDGYTLQNIASIRNAINHRSVKSTLEEEDQILRAAESSTANEEQKRQARLIRWRRKMDWDECMRALGNYTEAIRRSMPHID